MKPILCHLTVAGEPACERGYIFFRYGICCEHPSLRAAKMAAMELRKHLTRGLVKIVSGPCPVVEVTK